MSYKALALNAVGSTHGHLAFYPCRIDAIADDSGTNLDFATMVVILLARESYAFNCPHAILHGFFINSQRLSVLCVLITFLEGYLR